MNTTTPARPRGRPRKDTSHQDVRAALLRAGIEALTASTFSGNGLDGILRQAGVPKGSFYYYFASKEAFGMAVLDAYDDFFRHLLAKTLGDKTCPPLARIRAFVDSAARGMARHHFQRGCIVGNMAPEVGLLAEPFRARLNQILTGWQHQFEACLLEARTAQEIAPDSDCASLAAFFWTGWEGAVLRARLEQQRQPLDTFLHHYLRLLANT
ncbi:TetR family transcriptional regulator C-terminal domain-containing protein [Shimwellia blattae]|uniref:Transcriptional regulator n=1 Tax=Shimwellia blattae (strain ATCC 29907 / DSM 4481 / JCM 1650 / NBRC 105725 / CDC 9005-74) TaxID=630626 RepID=I2B8U6_SHIBC|nr:TetR family transcriptional regulator C-terminal domain-containing protein [Shimwellia blattae]AFJ46950.1 transcriptional regulator [Shimwellia blattae DSM 4481 = NBRC 105725]GAB82389.1 putative TetR family transcriptional regulator [Shimwellia blattae DSM 4481 = NBRC 105725]VDY64444.1 HTH-type transcriptional repressor nemR [Shimwellia blattae]VEC22552.1 HTH-type transcriptional repressor nemR [Shimwellia blattae]